MEDFEDLTKNCIACKILIEACKKLGHEEYCIKLLKELKSGEIDKNQFFKILNEKFGEKLKEEAMKIAKEKFNV